jgi:hypothetical protein
MLGEPETPYGRLGEKAKWRKGEMEKERKAKGKNEQL